ncbi:hypothetical protein NDU88_001041 [Pleurodeles waltl]|uniref:Uncharacterized protein n=1 Tax=Pleurodeles waltl TaxID=8319 RepID=A0AAV7THL8_PLEWA|nr:hypothetical protein NDU88_001041 [Pleurodeles waltl]
MLTHFFTTLPEAWIERQPQREHRGEPDVQLPKLVQQHMRPRTEPGGSPSAKEAQCVQRQAVEDTAALRVGAPVSPTASTINPGTVDDNNNSLPSNGPISSEHSDSDSVLPIIARTADDLM